MFNSVYIFGQVWTLLMTATRITSQTAETSIGLYLEIGKLASQVAD